MRPPFRLRTGVSGPSRQVWASSASPPTIRPGLSFPASRSCGHGRPPPRIICFCWTTIWVGGGDGAARLAGDTWLKYSSTDGLYDGTVNTIVKATDGATWFAGAAHGKSVAARFDSRLEGEKAWRHFSEADGLVGVSIGSGLAASNGDIWLGSKDTRLTFQGHKGVFRYDGGRWIAYTSGDGLLHDRIYRLAEDSNGHIWVGTAFGLNRFDGHVWSSHSPFPDQEARSFQKIRALSTTLDVWTGYGGPDGGAARFDPSLSAPAAWTRFTTADGLLHDGVWAIHQSPSGTVWAGTQVGLARYDETGWSSYEGEIGPDSIRARSIVETSDGAIWIRGGRLSGRLPGPLIRHIPDRNPPDTYILPAIDQVSSAGNVLLQWSGGDYYNDTPIDRLRYQYRVDDGDWSRSTRRRGFPFTSFADGDHRIEVRAIDWGGNVDPTPAMHAFIVEGPWWKNPYVAVSGLVMLGLIALQTGRVVRRDRRLRASNEALSSANNELFQVNVDLQREQVLERLRGQALGMQSSDEIGAMCESVFRELRGLGLPLISSGIGIVNDTGEAEVWGCSSDGSVLEAASWKLSADSPATRAQARGETYYHVEYDREQLKKQIRSQAELGNPIGFLDLPEDQLPERTHSYGIFFDRGRVQFTTRDTISEDHIDLIRRFGEAFGFAHARWEELKVKEAQNRRLAVEASVQRLRAEVQSMDEASDFERILSLLAESLESVELSFGGCEIDVVNEPVEHPTMDHFVANGYRYTTFSLDPSGSVSSNSYNLPAPFPTVIERTLERFIEGEPWQGMSEEQRIVEVPAGSYGRLRLTATDRETFEEDEIATLREFADAVALGYARYLDIREIQDQTERKSAFLASMSHELRTPMNAIKGFTNLVLGRRSENLNDRQRENLSKVSQASDHLLAMINDLLDLSKIERGMMEANVESFDVTELIASCCGTVSPLIQDGVVLRQDVAEDVGEANIDRARVQQMVIN